MRTDPKSFLPDLEERAKHFDGNVLTMPGADGGEFTQEGPLAVKDAIEYLKKAKPVHPLRWSVGIAKACEDHVKDMGSRGLQSHEGSDGSTFMQRLERYGKPSGEQGENIAYGQASGKLVVLQLLIDDGVELREHRKNMFSTEFNFTGNFSGAHEDVETMTVMDYAGSFEAPERLAIMPAPA